MDAPADGFSAELAKGTAQGIAANIRDKGKSYSHEGLKKWQRFAGITVDGLYGGQSVGALQFFLGKTEQAPSALYAPFTPTPYQWASLAGVIVAEPEPAPPAPEPTPPAPDPVKPEVVTDAPVEATDATPAEVPPDGFNSIAAEKQADRMAINIRTKQKKYSKKALRGWQSLAGITVDGLYGGQSVGALQFYLGTKEKAPKAIYNPKTPKPYKWAQLIKSTTIA